jgi:taurine transport system permease protein
MPDAPARLKTSRFKVPGEGSSVVISVVTVALLFAFWLLVTNMGWVKPLFLPSPQAVFQQFHEYLTGQANDKPLWQHFAASLFRVFSAFALACVTAIPIGIAMGMSRVARGIFDPPLEFYRPLPPLAYLPLIIIWFGIGEAAKIALITLAMLAPIVVSAQAGVRSVSEGRIQAALSLGASRRQVFFHVIARGALPEILTGLRIAVGAGWGTLVAAEQVAATRGLGFMTLSAAQFLVTEVVFVGIFSIAALALTCLAAIRLLERLLTPWKGND